MKRIYSIIFMFGMITLIACKKGATYHAKYTNELFNPKLFKLSCDSLFHMREMKVDLTSFYSNPNEAIKYPIQKLCDDRKIIPLFTDTRAIPYYVGSIHTVYNVKLEFFLFDNYGTGSGNVSTGYFSIRRQPGEYLIFKSYELYPFDGKLLRTYVKKNYILLWRMSNEAYDISDASFPEIDVDFCVLKISNSKTFNLVNRMEASALIKANFFGSFPSAANLLVEE